MQTILPDGSLLDIVLPPQIPLKVVSSRYRGADPRRLGFSLEGGEARNRAPDLWAHPSLAVDNIVIYGETSEVIRPAYF